MPGFYSRSQIMLHGLIFLLIAAQVLLHGPMSEAWERVEDGLEAELSPLVVILVVLGLLTLGLVVWRAVLRLMRGAPEVWPEQEPTALKPAAQLTYLGLYALLALMPVSGTVAWFGEAETAARAHEVMATLLLVLVGLHVMGALYRQFVLKPDTMARTKKPG